MKKLLLIPLAVFMFSACSCSDCENKTKTIMTKEGSELMYERFTLEEHEYIIFKVNSCSSNVSGIVHSEECSKCKKSNNSTDTYPW